MLIWVCLINYYLKEHDLQVHVAEDLPISSVITKVKAKDRDTGVNAAIIYEFSKHTAQEHGHLFGIKSESGKVGFL